MLCWAGGFQGGHGSSSGAAARASDCQALAEAGRLPEAEPGLGGAHCPRGEAQHLGTSGWSGLEPHPGWAACKAPESGNRWSPGCSMCPTLTGADGDPALLPEALREASVTLMTSQDHVPTTRSPSGWERLVPSSCMRLRSNERQTTPTEEAASPRGASKSRAPVSAFPALPAAAPAGLARV